MTEAEKLRLSQEDRIITLEDSFYDAERPFHSEYDYPPSYPQGKKSSDFMGFIASFITIPTHIDDFENNATICSGMYK